MCQHCYNSKIKPATAYTKKINEQAARKFGLDIKNANNSELEYAKKHCILPLPEDYTIYAEDGRKLWDLGDFQFLKEVAVPDTVNPSLWMNGKCNLQAGVFEVLLGKIYQVRGIDVANITFVRSKTGWIVLDVTTCVESAREGIRLLEKALGEPVWDKIRAVIISHSHVDHFGGIRGVVDEENVGSPKEGKVPIYVPAGFDEETIKENVYAGTAMFHRSKYQFGNSLNPGKTGRVSNGLGISMINGTVSFIRPTNHISEDTTITIDGLKVDFQITPGTEVPAEMNNYFPEYRAFWAAENCTGTLHNLYPIRGAQVRDSANWWKFTEVALEKYGDYTDVVFQSHNWPHENTEENPNMVKDFLRNSAAIYKFVHDQTLLYANLGKTSSEIAKKIQIPEALEKNWYTRPYYGSIEVNSRAVYNKYLGFYNGNPTTLDPLTEIEEAKQFVEYVGSEEKVLELARQDFDNGNYRKAAKAANYVVYVNPQNQDARFLCADAFEQLGYQSESSIWRCAYLAGAKDLREGIAEQKQQADSENTSKQDMIANMTTQMQLDYLGIVIDGNKLADADSRFHLYIVNDSGVKEEFLVHLYKGVLLYYEGHTEEELPYVRIPEGILLALVGKQLERVKPYVDTNCMNILEQIDNAVVDLTKHNNFALIEPNE